MHLYYTNCTPFGQVGTYVRICLKGGFYSFEKVLERMGKVASSLGNSYCQHRASNRFQHYKTLSAVKIDTVRDATAIPVVIHHLKFPFLDAERDSARSLSKIAFRCFTSASRSEKRRSLLLRSRSVSNAVLCWASSTAFLGSGGR